MTVIKSYLENNIGFIAMNRPEKRNALSVELAQALVGKIRAMDLDDQVKAIVLYGEGKAYSAGGDIETINSFTNPGEVMEYMKLATEVTDVIRKTKKYVISAIHGFAAGAGISLALVSDFIVMERDAKFSAGFTNIGLVPDLGLIKLLVERVSPSIAKEWLSSGQPIAAEELYSRGVVNLVSDGNLLREAAAFAEKVSYGSPITNQFVKYLVNQAQEMSTETYLMQEQIIQAMLAQTSDHKEAINSFINKKPPTFRGEW
ncbi:enoyl-CoA hydratase/isomerase family protein [Ornithinibacillus californiensis]|uniref:enoyl-CoA hydratase/isomerase family protein n=1 Tax=Ornithinibacillus californiensis TaxID=161536 RepID=UPI00064E1362|nr:enoyl-CoA hydratase/isomerase family protein [Ornithinibacillus californiensis]